MSTATTKLQNGHSTEESLKRVSFQLFLVFPQTTVRIVPGPGTYVNQEALENRVNGHYRLSNHRSTKAKVWNPPSSKRFNKSSIFCVYSVTDVPGPGNYQPKNDLSNEGKYVMSKNVSSGQRKFLDGRRLSFTDITARRSFSTEILMQLPDLEVTAVLQTSDSMTC